MDLLICTYLFISTSIEIIDRYQMSEKFCLILLIPTIKLFQSVFINGL